MFFDQWTKTVAPNVEGLSSNAFNSPADQNLLSVSRFSKILVFSRSGAPPFNKAVFEPNT
jgi:hypothetical protein